MDDFVLAVADRLDLDPVARGLWEALLPHVGDALRGRDAGLLTALEETARSVALTRATPVAALLCAYNDGCEQLIRLLEEAGGAEADDARLRLRTLEKPGLSRVAVGYCAGLEEIAAGLGRTAEEVSPLDAGTGALKPRELLSRLGQEAERCRRSDAPLGLVAVIATTPRTTPPGGLVPPTQETARCLRDGLRSYDSVGLRTAGVFVAVLPDVSRRGLAAAAQRVCGRATRSQGRDQAAEMAYTCLHYDEVDVGAEAMLVALDERVEELRAGSGRAVC